MRADDARGRAPQGPRQHYDVVVVGGGAAGVAAAAGAADSGARTLLVERYGMLGGAATVSSVLSYCGIYTQGEPWEQVVAGVADRVLAHLDKLGGCTERISRSSGNKFLAIDPEAVKLTLDRIVTDSGAGLLLHAQVIDAWSEHGQVKGLLLLDHGGGRIELTAEAFVDASGDGNLAFLAGAATMQPEPGEVYQSGTMMMRIGGIPAGVDTSAPTLRSAVRAHVVATGVTLPRETGILAPVPISGDLMAILADVDVDPLDAASLTRAELAGRSTAWAYLDAIRRHLPGAEGAYLVSTGPQLGVREGRRLLGREVITRDDVLDGRKRSDSVARCGWPIESHLIPGRSVYESVGGRSWYDIPYGALLSQTHDNLWAAGRIVSCDRDAFASLRVMGTAFATGQAAGVAAADWVTRHNHDIDAVRNALRGQNALV